LRKIQKILDRFDKDWWKNLSRELSYEEKSAVDILKTIRDQVSHGLTNGTGLSQIDIYFKHACSFIKKVETEVLGS
jgi:2-hydroxy-3-keto-5-methylthiopentenyl-1-phosphate phosphatase